MKKENFKVGDRVYHISYGWGIVTDIIHGQYPVCIKIENVPESKVWFSREGLETSDDKTSLLSFTEYTLQGFSRERPVELPKEGELCVVRDEEGDEWELCYFISYKSDAVTYKFETSFGCYKQMKRIKILD